MHLYENTTTTTRGIKPMIHPPRLEFSAASLNMSGFTAGVGKVGEISVNLI